MVFNTGCPGLKYPKVMAYYYGTKNQNVINCSSLDWKTPREFLGLVRSAARARLIRQLKTINLLHFFSKERRGRNGKRYIAYFG
ncbi:hypothetical protein TNCV_3841651 [Trichonephila clavipes]|nr:hypothetical protein TNCV_3841651 [Trichonephila clavipes]